MDTRIENTLCVEERVLYNTINGYMYELGIQHISIKDIKNGSKSYWNYYLTNQSVDEILMMWNI